MFASTVPPEPAQHPTTQDPVVVTLADGHLIALRALLAGYGMTLRIEPDGAAIPGSYWGDREAGLVGDTLHVRMDTPLHSALHEACHYLCMNGARRAGLHTDAGGDDAEEEAVCYLQVLLADALPGYSRAQLFADMDAWGYHFIAGSAAAWFATDSADAQRWLLRHGLITPDGQPSGRLRT